MGLQQDGISRIIKGLETAGWRGRKPCSKDRRQLLSLTREGGGKIRAYPEIIHNSLPASFPADFVAFSCRASQHACKKSPCLPKNLTVQSAYVLFRDRLLLCWNQKNPMKGGLT